MKTLPTILQTVRDVHAHMGPGHSVQAYRQAIARALRRRGLRVIESPNVFVTGKYGHRTLLGRPDLLVRNGAAGAALISISGQEHVPPARVERMGMYVAAWRGPVCGLVVAFGSGVPLWEKECKR